MTVLLLVLGLFLFVGLVVIHELGHYIAARRNGIEAEEFGIGFPPRIWSKKLKNGTLLSINLLPLGGYVKLKGENDSAKEKGSYGAAPLMAKIKVMTAGVGMNLLAALILLTILAFLGMPKIIDNQFTVKNDTKIIKNEVLIGYIEPGSPAERAGLKTRDQIVAFNAAPKDTVYCLSLDCPKAEIIPVTDENKLPEITKQLAGQQIGVEYRRGGQTSTVQVKLREINEVDRSKNTDNPKGYLGIAPTQYTLQRSTWSAPIVAAGLAKQITFETFKGLGKAIGSLVSGDTGKASDQVAGPVGIFVLLKDGSLLGYEFMLFIIAIISLTLAIMNILPIPALDGGRLFVTLLFRGLKKPLTKQAENLIHGMGFVLLMLLFIVITIVDIRRFF